MSSLRRLQRHYQTLNKQPQTRQNNFNQIETVKISQTFDKIIDKVYLINLDQDADRLKHVDTQLKQLGIPYERFAAINGQKVDIEELSKDNMLKRQALKAAHFNRGSLGCYLSHVAVYQKILQDGHQRVLILEDDIDIISDFKNALVAAYPRMPANWDLLYLGYNMIHGTKIHNDYYIPKEGNHQGYNSGMFGYMVSREGAYKLINLLIPIYHPIKDPTIRSNFSKLNAYFMAKKLIFHNADKFVSIRNTLNRV